MKKLILVVLTLGLSISTSALAAVQNNEVPDVLMAIGGQVETLNISTRPRPPRPPHISEERSDSTNKNV